MRWMTWRAISVRPSTQAGTARHPFNLWMDRAYSGAAEKARPGINTPSSFGQLTNQEIHYSFTICAFYEHTAPPFF
jgi:hypothetical protein